VSVSYVDDLNQTQTYSDTLTVEVLENSFPSEGIPGESESPVEEPLSFWGQVGRFFKALFGLGS